MVKRDYVWRIVIFVIFMGFRGAKRCEDVLKSSFGKGGEGGGGQGVPLCNAAVLKLYCNSYWVLQKNLIPLFLITAVLPVLYLLRLARPKMKVKVS